MRNSRYQLAIQLIEKYAIEDQRMQKLLSRIPGHVGAANENTSKLYEQTARISFTVRPWQYGPASEELTEDLRNDQEKSVAELIVANHDRISEEEWFSDAESHV